MGRGTAAKLDPSSTRGGSVTYDVWNNLEEHSATSRRAKRTLQPSRRCGLGKQRPAPTGGRWRKRSEGGDDAGAFR